MIIYNNAHIKNNKHTIINNQDKIMIIYMTTYLNCKYSMTWL